MALQTASYNLTGDAFTLVGENVTMLVATTLSDWPFHVHVVETGGSAPTISSPYIEVPDNEFEYVSGTPADIYMKALGSTVKMGVISE